MRLTQLFSTLSLVLALHTGCATRPICSPVQVAPGVFSGCMPASAVDFRVLRRHGVRTILSLETMACHVVPERKLAQQFAMEFRNVPILPSFIPPTERRIREGLMILHDPSLRPVFVHCLVGDDRTSFITGLYRIYFENWTPQAAWNEMIRSGFHANWWLFGLQTYFWHHTRQPEWAKLPVSQLSSSGRPAGR